MDEKALKLYEEMKKEGLTPEEEEKILRELNASENREHEPTPEPHTPGVYEYTDMTFLQSMSPPQPSYTMQLRSMDELLERDKQREKDGFPRKIQVGKLIKPSRGGKDKVVIVPTTVEEKIRSPLTHPRRGRR